MSDSPSIDPDAIIAATKTWIERAVIGLNLCPFASAVYVTEKIRYAVSSAQTREDLLLDLQRELETLAEAPASKIDTTLLMHPLVLNDFLDYNDFLDIADALIDEMDLEGVIQVASFHPKYQFEDTEPDEISNFSNRAPYPTLHLLRESSVEAALERYPEAESIYERNIETLQKLGIDGWLALGIGAPITRKH